MKISELYSKLTEIIPTSLSCSWDRDGLEVCPDGDREVRRVLIALDVTEEVIDKAIKEKFNVIIAHHPLFFKGVDSLNVVVPDGRRAIKLIQNNIAIMTFHTRLDALTGGVNDILAGLLGLKNVEIVYGENEQIMRVGNLEEEMPPEDFARLVKFALGATCIQLSACDKPSYKIALLGGSGDSDLGLAQKSGADTYLTGELRYHSMLASGDVGMNIIAAGHFYTEYPVTKFLEKTVGELCPDAEIEVFFSDRVQVI